MSKLVLLTLSRAEDLEEKLKICFRKKASGFAGIPQKYRKLVWKHSWLEPMLKTFDHFIL